MTDVETELRLGEDEALFVVRTSAPDFALALRKMAFAEAGGEFVRRFRATEGVARIHATFERHLEEMLGQRSGRHPVPWRAAVSEVAARFAEGGLDWFLIGSAALAVRGVDVEPLDLDLVVADAHRAASLLEAELVEPLSYDADRGWIARWFGRAFAGSLVEWVAGVYPEVDELGPNEHGPEAASRLERVGWAGHELLLTPLDLQLDVMRRRGHAERLAATEGVAKLSRR